VKRGSIAGGQMIAAAQIPKLATRVFKTVFELALVGDDNDLTSPTVPQIR
jgi:hypothetical protein